MKPFYTFGLACLLFCISFISSAQTISENYSVQISVLTETNPPSITLVWKAVEGATEYRVFRKSPTSLDWGTVGATLGPDDTAVIDSGVMPGQVYEYKVEASRGNNPTTAFGYVMAGIQAPATENRGGIALVVDDFFSTSLSTELEQLEMDLVGDGYVVYRVDVSRNNSPMLVRSRIMSIYNNNPDVFTALLVGHVPVPYSGNINPDGHSEHRGAWPTDGFYADMDANWTDMTVNTTTASRMANQNVPGDGKYDHSIYPSPLELRVGRIDFANMPAFPDSEEELMRKYLNKLSNFKHGMLDVVFGGVIDDNFVGMAEGFAQNGYRNFGPLVGFPNVAAGDYFSTLTNTPLIWSYGCGPGSYTSAGGIGNTNDFVNNESQGVFTMLFGSYFGDWDTNNNFLRAALASGNTLTNVWAGRPNWFFHRMGLNETIGISSWLSQNNLFLGNLYQSTGFANSWVHSSFMGDPTLKMFNLKSPSFTDISQSGGNVEITWEPGDTNHLGYRLYRASERLGPYEPVVDAIIVSNFWIDSCVGTGDYYYQLRPYAIQGSASGTFFNLGTGVFQQFTVADVPATVTVSAAAPSCVDGTDGSASIDDISDAVGPYSIEWSTGATSSQVTGLSSGTYGFTITDFCGKTSAGEVTISDPDPIVPNASATDESAAGANDGSATANPSGGDGNYSFAWSNGQNMQTITGLSPGDYTVTITDGNGCFATQTITVAMFGCNLSIAINTFDALCNGGLGSIIYSVSGGTAPYTFTETPPGDYPAGTYNYTLVDDNNCEVSGTFSINEPDPLTPGTETVVHPTCPSDTDGSISIDPEGGTGPYTVNWSTGASGNSITDLASGDYSVSIIDDNNCRFNNTYTLSGEDITPPALALIPVTTVSLDADGLVNIDAAMIDAGTADNCGGYTLTLSQVAFDCNQVGSNQITVTATDDAGNTVSEDITIEVVDDTPPEIICPADITVDGCEEVINYNLPTWSDNCTIGQPVRTSGMPTGSTFSSGTGTVSYEIVDAGGNIAACSFTITVRPTFAFENASVEDATCFGDTDGSIDVTVTGGTPNILFSWSNGETGSSISGLPAGTYTLNITDGSCSYTETYEVTEPTAVAGTIVTITQESSAGNDGAIDMDASGGVGPYSFVWTDENGTTISTDEDPSGLTAGIYAVEITDAAGCSIIIDDIVVTRMVGTSSIDFPGSWKVYPNPANEFVLLEAALTSRGNAVIKIYSSTGMLVAHKELGVTKHVAERLETSQLATGLYLIEMRLDGKRYYQKLMVD